MLSSVVAAVTRVFPGQQGGYQALPGGPEDGDQNDVYARAHSYNRLAKLGLFGIGSLGVLYVAGVALTGRHGDADRRPLSQLWGQYSPVYSVPSEISWHVPDSCEVTFAQVLSRHAARDPTPNRWDLYNETLARIRSTATEYRREYQFLKEYEFTLGTDELTEFGRLQMRASGREFYERYHALGEPFIRASGQQRVLESSHLWTHGFYEEADGSVDAQDRIDEILVIPEGEDVNNTLSVKICPNFKYGKDGLFGKDAQATWRDVFAPPILERMRAGLPGANVTIDDVIYLMDLCPFGTVANVDLAWAPFCRLFSREEWKDYDYYQSLGKYYGYTFAHPFGPTIGVGYVNELVARLTGRPVRDQTSTNATLVGSPETFPLDAGVYADFSHDNEIIAILSALGLFNATLGEDRQLDRTRRNPHARVENGDFVVSTIAPFAARLYVEKLRCDGEGEEEYVRFILNDRVVPPSNCGADARGRCRLSKFVESMGYARSGGRWTECPL